MLSVQSRNLYNVSLYSAPTKFYAKMLSMIQDFLEVKKISLTTVTDALTFVCWTS